MIPYDEAFQIVLDTCHPIGQRQCLLEDLVGFVLAEPIISPFDLPLFDSAAVDGFGVRFEDIEKASSQSPVCLPLAGIVKAGDSNNLYLNPGHTIRLLTGSPIPNGVESVIMQEFSAKRGDDICLLHSAERGENIRRRGEECREGSQMMTAGKWITPSVVGLLATLGYAEFPVYEKPVVGVVVTGNELVPPGKPLAPGQLYDSNSYAISAAIQALGLEKPQVAHALDEPEQLYQTLEKVLSTSDVLLVTGGVSVGDYDFVKEMLVQLGVKTLFWKVSVKPGKPVYFGEWVDSLTQRKKWIFGLPGNPVAALVLFHQFIKPALIKIMGLHTYPSQKINAKLTLNIFKKPGRMELVRGILSYDNGDWLVKPTIGQESHMLSGLATANCLIHFPKELGSLNAGESVTVETLQWETFCDV